MMQKIQQAGGGGQKFQALRRWTPPPHRTHKKNSLSEKVKAKS
ncbi:Uncharacterised protein [Acinetobacter baumannii]|nr:Uncharacterised protein [Acinetobacter baumannii]SSV81630.1 Uncharacterised protein [Acinetobacter baumannii]SSV85600.1 Uncharacterised protein [Acinetobacter baumannii]SSW23332.1 Uncharacterised protein [Acinetobacter baumannii]SSW27500.1 Uncharacterised protein [Acinetobacter baumannii]